MIATLRKGTTHRLGGPEFRVALWMNRCPRGADGLEPGGAFSAQLLNDFMLFMQVEVLSPVRGCMGLLAYATSILVVGRDGDAS